VITGEDLTDEVGCVGWMERFIFFEGFIVGLVLCAPVGPIGLLCMRRALAYGRAAGVVSLLGAATVDGLYCSVAGLGVTFVANFLRDEQLLIREFGGLVLVLVGLKIFFSDPPDKTNSAEDRGLLRWFWSTVLLTMANPMTILVFTAAFTALGVHGSKGNLIETLAVVGGVFCGSAIWSPILVLVVTLFRPMLEPRQLRLINRTSGAIIAALGLTLSVTALL